MSKRERLQVELNSKTISRIDQAMEFTGARSRIDVIRGALSLFLYMAENAHAGWEIKVTKSMGDTEILVEFPGLGLR